MNSGEVDSNGEVLRAYDEERTMHNTRIVSIDVPFWDLVWLLIKLAIATIPAAILLWVFWVGLLLFLGLLGVGVESFNEAMLHGQ